MLTYADVCVQVSEHDVEIAATAKADIFTFNLRAPPAAVKKTIKSLKVQVSLSIPVDMHLQTHIHAHTDSLSLARSRSRSLALSLTHTHKHTHTHQPHRGLALLEKAQNVSES